MVTCLSLRDRPNVGDKFSSPHWYFPIYGAHLDMETHADADDNVLIFGGGAIAGRAKAWRTRGIKIAWGVGTTQRGKFMRPQMHDTRGFALYGSRDWQDGGPEWVPCASCMSRLFDIAPEPVVPVVHYGHALLSPMDQMNNDQMSMVRVIEHLSCGETVVTSSYHGMYWALLLGRRVIAKPFGTKFFGLPWGGVWDGSSITFEAKAALLDEAREANMAFWEKVKRYV